MYLCLSRRAPQPQPCLLLGILFLSAGAAIGCSSSGNKSPQGVGGNQDASASSGGTSSGGSGGAGGLAGAAGANDSGGTGPGASGGTNAAGASGRSSGGQVGNTGGSTGGDGRSGGNGGAGGISAGGASGSGKVTGGTTGVGGAAAGTTSLGGVTGGTTGAGGAAGGATGGSGTIAPDRVRTIQSFNDDWLFNYGDAAGADATAFADSAWRRLSVPHDWAIEGPNPPADPFSQNAPSTGPRRLSAVRHRLVPKAFHGCPKPRRRQGLH